MSHLGDILAEARKKAGLTVDQLAKESGLSLRAIYYLERTSHSPILSTVLKVNRVLKIQPDKLLAEAMRDL